MQYAHIYLIQPELETQFGLNLGSLFPELCSFVGPDSGRRPSHGLPFATGKANFPAGTFGRAGAGAAAALELEVVVEAPSSDKWPHM